jgi:hypothetical protein
LSLFFLKTIFSKGSCSKGRKRGQRIKMHLNRETIKALRNIAKKDEYDYFFDNMRDKKSEVPEELIDEIAYALIDQLDLSVHDKETVAYFIRLGFFAAP